MNNSHRFQNFRHFTNLFSKIWLKKRQTSLLSGICREIRTNFHQKFAENNAKFNAENEKNRKFNIQSRKNVDDFWLKFWVWRTVQRSALCISRRELSNEYLLAKFGFDTAENEPCKVCPLSAYRSARCVHRRREFPSRVILRRGRQVGTGLRRRDCWLGCK